MFLQTHLTTDYISLQGIRNSGGSRFTSIPKPVQLAILPAQSSEQRVMVGRCTGRTLNQLGSGITLAVAVHSFLEPAKQAVEPSLRKILVDIPQFGTGPGE